MFDLIYEMCIGILYDDTLMVVQTYKYTSNVKRNGQEIFLGSSKLYTSFHVIQFIFILYTKYIDIYPTQ